MAGNLYDSYTQKNPVHDEERVTCAVCGFKGNDMKKLRFRETSSTTYVTTGTYYNSNEAPSDDVTLLDLIVTPVIGSGDCAFCGTPRVLDGSAGDLLV